VENEYEEEDDYEDDEEEEEEEEEDEVDAEDEVDGRTRGTRRATARDRTVAPNGTKANSRNDETLFGSSFTAAGLCAHVSSPPRETHLWYMLSHMVPSPN
jgi:hypothetical protein